MLERSYRWVADLSVPMVLVLSFGLLILISVVDYFTGFEVSLAVFYLVPLGLFAWHLGWGWGVGFAALCALAWQGVNTASGATVSAAWILVWNVSARFVFNLTFAVLVDRLRHAYQAQHQLARRDPLTGAYNRIALEEALTLHSSRFVRHPRPFCLAAVDLDHFKRLNDQFGHAAGDQALIAVAQRSRELLRDHDLVARLGGDEFLLVLDDCGRSAAEVALRRLLDGLEGHFRDQGWPITVSAGLVEHRTGAPDWTALKAEADRRLYRAKADGRHRICGE